MLRSNGSESNNSPEQHFWHTTSIAYSKLFGFAAALVCRLLVKGYRLSRLSANLLLLLAGAIWGMGFVAQQTAMDSVGPFTFIASRFLIASIVVLPFAVRESTRSTQTLPVLTAMHFVQFALIGFCLFAGMATQQFGLLRITVTDSGFLTGLYVVFTPLWSVLLFRTWPHPVVWPAAWLALSGTVLLGGGSLEGFSRGHVLTVASAGFWAMQVVLIGRFVSRSQRPLCLSFVQFAVTCLLATIAAFLLEQPDLASVRGAAKEILYTGIFATGIAFSLQVIGQRYTSASQAAIFLSSEALFAALFGALLLGDRLSSAGLAGCALIFAAMLLVELVPHYRFKRAAS